MTRFAFAPADVKVGGFEVFPKGDYEVSVKAVKPFQSVDSATGAVRNHGVAFSCKIVGGEFDGKPYYHRGYLHSEGAAAFTKQAVMAFYGFAQSQEKEFNEEYGDKDWGYDPETGELGEVWKGTVGKRASVSLDQQIQTQGKNAGEIQQKVNGYSPLV